MTSLNFILGLIALLFAPGPTNALLALSGAEAGAWRTLRLLPFVALAYAITVLPLSLLGDELQQQQHWVRAAVGFAAALWVAWMAVALWHGSGQAAGATPGSSRAARLFITTLLNPKAFVIGLVLVPAQPSQPMAIVMFFVVLTMAGAAWSVLGSALHGSAQGLPVLRRICAAWLGLLAVLLGSAAFAA
ncbi:hypothetical protein DK847_14040 [Aestuariivirga litoralis]|uniref:Threonine transporter RhtB n=1 Tax=Aestuariivirga litoralis TaxID=2650924 RepID=A0A2W2BS88_9HYPH|nr:hypothetical protein [Aestuariivirga litoralis]PZF76306.1 hypothetical protein DK847_14040 [Aestuariivirga litoralis]